MQIAKCKLQIEAGGAPAPAHRRNAPTLTS
jgi:hypothetical protein